MAPVNDGISHPHNRPGSKSFPMAHRISGPHNRPDSKTSNAQKDWVPKAPRGTGHKPVDHSPSTPVADNDTTNDNPPPSPSPCSTTGGISGNDPDNTPPGPSDTDDDGMSTLEKMLSPPEFDTTPQSESKDIRVFCAQHRPHIRVGPFFPQPPNPFKERKGAFNSRRNWTNKRRNISRHSRANNGDESDGDDSENDGDDEDDDGPDNVDDPITPILTSSTTATHIDPSATPRRVTRSQAINHNRDSPTPSPRTLAPPSKRKRNDSKTDPATPTRGQRTSKRQRKSISESPLPPMKTIKRTRAEQKKFQAKFDHLIFDPERPGSVEREVVEIKSGAKEWRKASLHDELWDGNAKFE